MTQTHVITWIYLYLDNITTKNVQIYIRVFVEETLKINQIESAGFLYGLKQIQWLIQDYKDPRYIILVLFT